MAYDTANMDARSLQYSQTMSPTVGMEGTPRAKALLELTFVGNDPTIPPITSSTLYKNSLANIDSSKSNLNGSYCTLLLPQHPTPCNASNCSHSMSMHHWDFINSPSLLLRRYN